MPKRLHGCAFTEEVSDCAFRLNLEHLNRNGCLSPESFVDNAVSSLRNLALEDEFFEVNLHVAVEDSRLHSKFVEQLFYMMEGVLYSGPQRLFDSRTEPPLFLPLSYSALGLSTFCPLRRKVVLLPATICTLS